MSSRILLSSLLLFGCTHYQLEVAATSPGRLPPGVNMLETSACPSAQWRTSYDWHARADKTRTPGRAVRVSSRCVEPVEQAPAAGKVELDGDARLVVSGSAGEAADPRMLEEFTFSGQDGVVDIKDGGGRTRTIVQVERITYYRNAVILRVAGGGGFILDPGRVLGVRWSGDAKAK